MITNNLIVKIQILIANHESRPVKSNPWARTSFVEFFDKIFSFIIRHKSAKFQE